MKGQAGLFRVVIVVIAILIGLGKLKGNWMGLKVEVNRECQMLDREPCTIFTQGWQKARLDLPLC